MLRTHHRYTVQRVGITGHFRLTMPTPGRQPLRSISSSDARVNLPPADSPALMARRPSDSPGSTKQSGRKGAASTLRTDSYFFRGVGGRPLQPTDSFIYNDSDTEAHGGGGDGGGGDDDDTPRGKAKRRTAFLQRDRCAASHRFDSITLLPD